MSKTQIMSNVSRTFHKVGFVLKKHSPEILVVAGSVGTVIAGVMACKATTKLEGVLSKSKADVETIHNYVEENGYSEEYTESDSKKDLAIVYAKTGVELIKLYGPSVAVGALSIGAIFTSNNMMRKRNMALAAAYATVDHNFKDYRKRVVDRFGKDLDRELKYNIKAKELEETIIDEDGNEQTVTSTVETAEIPNNRDEFTRCFDETCTCWVRDAEDNLVFLNQVQNWANEKLRSKGYLFLNDVYEALGMQISRHGSSTGWVYDKDQPESYNVIDFGIYDLYDKEKRLFVNGYEKSIWLNFNVHGNVYDLMH